MRAVGRPHGIFIIGGVCRELREAEPIGVHHINIVVAIAVGREGNFRPVGRGGRVEIIADVVGQIGDRQPIFILGVDLPVAIAVARKEDLLVRRQRLGDGNHMRRRRRPPSIRCRQLDGLCALTRPGI